MSSNNLTRKQASRCEPARTPIADTRNQESKQLLALGNLFREQLSPSVNSLPGNLKPKPIDTIADETGRNTRTNKHTLTNSEHVLLPRGRRWRATALVTLTMLITPCHARGRAPSMQQLKTTIASDRSLYTPQSFIRVLQPSHSASGCTHPRDAATRPSADPASLPALEAPPCT